MQTVGYDGSQLGGGSVVGGRGGGNGDISVPFTITGK